MRFYSFRQLAVILLQDSACLPNIKIFFLRSSQNIICVKLSLVLSEVIPHFEDDAIAAAFLGVVEIIR